jgi:hypothetical protein
VRERERNAATTAHMPESKPDFGDVMVLDYEFGYILFTTYHHCESTIFCSSLASRYWRIEKMFSLTLGCLIKVTC